MDIFERRPSTSEYVAVHAAMEPARIAVVFGGEALSYGLVYQHIGNFTVGLQALGIVPGDRCIVSVGHAYVHWLVLLALENLGAVSCSVRADETDTLKPLMACTNKLISQEGALPGATVEWVHLPMEWMQTQLNARFDEARYQALVRQPEPQSAQRIKRSSGTTGGMKNMLMTNSMEEVLIQQYADVMGFTRETRYLVSSGFVISSVYLCATLCLRLGAMVVFDRGEDKLDLIARNRVSHVRFFPQQLLELLTTIEEGKLPKPRGLTVILGAAPVSRKLWDRVMALLATHIVYTYNANECGSICVMGPDGLGVVRAGVEVSIVGPDDKVLAPGQTGRIRVKAPGMLRSYINNPAASRNNFRDGWFYTGDAGQFIGPRRLKLLGRIDDVLIFAGFKRGADEYEAEVCAVPGIEQACALAVPDALGVDRLVLCVVASPGLERKALAQEMAKKFPSFITEGGKAFFVERLPRTDNGKLQRAVMRTRVPELTGGYAF